MTTSNGSNNVSVSSPALWMAIDVIDLYVTPVWYILGIPGNILAFVVWVQRRMRPSSGCYLAALALDECLFLFMQVTVRLPPIRTKSHSNERKTRPSGMRSMRSNGISFQRDYTQSPSNASSLSSRLVKLYHVYTVLFGDLRHLHFKINLITCVHIYFNSFYKLSLLFRAAISEVVHWCLKCLHACNTTAIQEKFLYLTCANPVAEHCCRCVAGILRATSEVEHQPATTARSLWTLSLAVSHSTAPQSTTCTRIHHGPLRVGLSSVRTGALLLETSTPGDYLCTNGNRAGNQRCTSVLLDVQLRQRRLRPPSWGESYGCFDTTTTRSLKLILHLLRFV